MVEAGRERGDLEARRGPRRLAGGPAARRGDLHGRDDARGGRRQRRIGADAGRRRKARVRPAGRERGGDGDSGENDGAHGAPSWPSSNGRRGGAFLAERSEGGRFSPFRSLPIQPKSGR
jgi:hypothetical protein